MDPFTLLLVAGAGYLLLRGKAKPSLGAMAANMAIPPPEPFTPFPPFVPEASGNGPYVGPGLQIVTRPVRPIGVVSAPSAPARPPPPTQPAPEVAPIGSIGGSASPLDLFSQGTNVQTAA